MPLKSLHLWWPSSHLLSLGQTPRQAFWEAGMGKAEGKGEEQGRLETQWVNECCFLSAMVQDVFILNIIESRVIFWDAMIRDDQILRSAKLSKVGMTPTQLQKYDLGHVYCYMFTVLLQSYTAVDIFQRSKQERSSGADWVCWVTLINQEQWSGEGRREKASSRNDGRKNY